MKTFIVALIVLVNLVSCVSGPTQEGVTVSDEASLTPQPTYTARPTYTPQPTYTSPPTFTPTIKATDTRRPTHTPYPTHTAVGPTATPTLHPEVRKCDDLMLKQNLGGVIIRVKAIAFAPVNVLEEEAKELYDSLLEDEVVTWGMISVQVENSTDMLISVHPAQATVIVGQEQVATDLWYSDDVGGDLYPGVVKEGGVSFSLKRTEASEVTQIRYIIDPPSDENYDRLAKDAYEFTIECQE